MRWRRLQIFFCTIFLALCLESVLAEPVYQFEMMDVDQNKISTTDGHLTVIVLTRSTDTDQVRLVGDHVPPSCLGNPAMRFITLLTFTKKHSKPTQLLFNMLARRRLDAEARRLQPRYAAKNLTRNPRTDVFAVLDFDGSISARLEMGAHDPVSGARARPEGRIVKEVGCCPIRR